MKVNLYSFHKHKENIYSTFSNSKDRIIVLPTAVFSAFLSIIDSLSKTSFQRTSHMFLSHRDFTISLLETEKIGENIECSK